MTHTKLGCRTCKIRKVKCDEGRPACRRCVSTGRVCSGYGIWGGGGSFYTQRRAGHRCVSQKIAKTPPYASMHESNGEEKSILDWFYHRAAKKLPGAFITTFWSMILQQTSMQEPAILHAVLTLSSVHHSGTKRETVQALKQSTSDEHFMLTHYTKAIQSLQPHLERKDRSSIRVALIACIVFTYLEYLRGHYQTALKHLQSGFLVFIDFQSTQREETGAHLRRSQDLVDDSIEETLTRLFVQLELFTQFHQHSWPMLSSVTANRLMPILFDTHTQAWKYLENIYCRIFDLTKLQQYDKFSIDSFPLGAIGHFEEQCGILSKLSQWLEIYSASEAGLNSQEPSGRVDLLLREFHIMANIMASTCLRAIDDESNYDAHTKGFLYILSISVRLWASRPQSFPYYNPITHMSRSIVGTGWLPPLFFTALKCRVHRIRWHALRLLGSTFHREGLWDSRLVSTVAMAVVQIEEGDFYQQDLSEDKFALDDVPELKDLDAPMLPLQSRLTEMKVLLPEGPSEDVGVLYKRGGLWSELQVHIG